MARKEEYEQQLADRRRQQAEARQQADDLPGGKSSATPTAGGRTGCSEARLSVPV